MSAIRKELVHSHANRQNGSILEFDQTKSMESTIVGSPSATVGLRQLAELVVHVGLHKTGTTALQTHLFPKMEGMATIADKDGLVGLLQAMAVQPTVLISDEEISSNPWAPSAIPLLDRFRQNLLSLQRVFSPDKYIIGFRQHSGFVQSCYSQYLHEGGTLPFENFYRLDGGPCVLDLLREFVGDENVFVYCQEDLASDADGVCTALAAFIGVKVPQIRLRQRNVGVGRRRGAILRRCNQADVVLRRLRLPTLRGRMLKLIGINSRRICQRWLSFLPEERNFAPDAEIRAMNRFYQDDWLWTIANRSYKPTTYRRRAA